jgi:transcriptional regulator with XRE-family HTH domain
MDESAIYAQLGQLVRQHRERLNMNQETLGTAIGLSRASIANIETGRQRIPLHHLYRLARALKVEAHSLLPTSGGEGHVLAERKIKSSVGLSEREQAEIARVVGSIDTSSRRRTE